MAILYAHVGSFLISRESIESCKLHVAGTAQYRSVQNWQLLTIQLLESKNYCKVNLIFEWWGLALLGPFLTTPLCSGKLTSHDLPGQSEIYQGLGPYGPGCSYATAGASSKQKWNRLKMA